MSQLAALKSAVSRNDVAKLLQTTLQGLTAILYTIPIANRYTAFSIPKKGGGIRTIKAPDDRLKLLQKKLSVLLQDCLDEINAAKNIGSAQESVEARILGCFPEDDKFGLGRRHPLRFQQEVTEILIAPAAP
jgi:hypothetical protein